MKKGKNIMVEQPQYPIDDNTLFILLALRYQGKIEIDGLDSVYDDVVNYSYTEIKQNKDKQRISEIADNGIKWIIETFGAEKMVGEGGKITLTLETSNELKKYLKEYLSKFVSYENYYLDEYAHKSFFYNFIKKNFQDIVEYRKSFTYRFIPNQQYKMIEYVGYLMNQGVLSTTCDKDIFTFDNDDTYKKVIQLKFADEYDIEKFIAKGQKYPKGIFYVYEKDLNVYNNKNSKSIEEADLQGELTKLLHYCIKENLNEISYDTYRIISTKKRQRKGGSVSDKTIMNYYNRINSDLNNILEIENHVFFMNNNHTGIWKLDFEVIDI